MAKLCNLDERVRQNITGYVHCTTPRVLRLILDSGEIKTSNAVRTEQEVHAIAEHVQTRDRGHPGADGVYARFLLTGMGVTTAKYGTSSSRGVRIRLKKAECENLDIITTSVGDYKGHVTGLGGLSDLNRTNVFNAEVCFRGNIPIDLFSAVFISKPKYDIEFGTFPTDNPLRRAIANCYITMRNENDLLSNAIYNQKKTVSEKKQYQRELVQSNITLVDEIEALFRRRHFTSVTIINQYYKFTQG